jgi:hypothetical protein
METALNIFRTSTFILNADIQFSQFIVRDEELLFYQWVCAVSFRLCLNLTYFT